MQASGRARRARHGQAGATLLVGLIMLVLITMAAVTAHNLARGNLQAVANMGYHNDTAAAAQQTIEAVISSTKFVQAPNAVFSGDGACPAVNTRCYDVNGDGSVDVRVGLTPAPACRTGRVLSTAELDFDEPEDLGCAVSTSQTFGIKGSVTADSLCGQTVWDVRARADDAATRTSVRVTQGVGVRVSLDDLEAFCPTT
ncbi:MAG: hypothetical protein JSW68_06310 [Burkholderiales bacterium]|nr:MAG: hypothetical protein JSW68_06310 [Burkholderiales bacterium]